MLFDHRPEGAAADGGGVRPGAARPFGGKGQVDIASIGGGIAGRATFQPGWKWSEHVKPIVGTDSCQAAHLGYIVSGRQTVQVDDGTRVELRACDFRASPPGHRGDLRRVGP